MTLPRHSLKALREGFEAMGGLYMINRSSDHAKVRALAEAIPDLLAVVEELEVSFVSYSLECPICGVCRPDKTGHGDTCPLSRFEP